MKYKNPIISGVFLRRINRFVAEVEIDGKMELVHVRNTGRCKEIFLPNAKIFLEESNGEKRKTKYSLVSVYKEDRLINVDSQIVNYVFEEAVLNNKIDFLVDLDIFKREQSYKNSRFDFYYEKGLKKGFIELKGVTLEKENDTMFPDAPTSRGKKHLMELIQGVEEGFENYVVFLIQMEGTEVFRPNQETDPAFTDTLKLAINQGVSALAFDSIISKDSITLNKAIEIKI